MNKKRITAGVLAGIMVLSSLAACGKKDNGPVKTRRTNVYSGEDMTLPEGINYIERVLAGGDKLYFVYSKEVAREYDPEKDGQYLPDIAVPYGAEVETAAPANVVMAETEAAVLEEPAVDDAVTEDAPAVEEEVIPEVYYDYLNCVYQCNYDGTDGKEYTLTQNGNSYIGNMSVAPDGTLWMMEQEWWNNADYTESGTYYRAYPFNFETGEPGEKIDLNAVIEASGLVEEGGYYYINQFFIDGAGLLHLSLETGVITCGMNGSIVNKCQITDGWISNMLVSGTEVFVSVYPTNGNQTLYRYDTAAGTLTKVESEILSGAMETYYNFGGVHPEGKIYLRNNVGIAAYDIASDTLNDLMDYINCDIDSSSMNQVAYTTDGRIISTFTDWNSGTAQTTCTLYTRIPDEEMQEEVIINLATTYINYNLRRTIIRFNKRNTGVRISVKDYNEYNNQENDWQGAVTQLNADMVTGKIPDILVIDSGLPAESYFQKNLFVDLNTYIDGENGIDRSTLMQNVLDACETNGKLNSIIPSFYMYTLTAKSEHVGPEPGWTLEEMMETIRRMPEGMNPFFEYSRDQIIENLFRYSMDAFIDWDTGETFFDTQGFIDLIEFLKNAPEKGYWDAYYESMEGGDYNYELEMEMQENYELRFYKDLSLFSMQYIGDFRGFQNAVRNFATEEITMIGYPTRDENGNGATIVPELELAICSASKCRDEAWTFIKYLLTDEEYLSDIYSFTLNKAKLEEQYKQAEAENEYYYEMTEDDYAWYYENYSEEYVNFLKSTQRKYTAEDGAKIMEILNGVTRVTRTDSSVLDIVKEELSSFFGGTKNAADTANIINSRVRIYVSENS